MILINDLFSVHVITINHAKLIRLSRAHCSAWGNIWNTSAIQSWQKWLNQILLKYSYLTVWNGHQSIVGIQNKKIPPVLVSFSKKTNLRCKYVLPVAILGILWRHGYGNGTVLNFWNPIPLFNRISLIDY